MGLPKILTFKFHEDKLKELWLDFEITMGIEDVIIAVKTAKTKLDFIKVLGVIGDAFKKTSTLGEAFLQDERNREELAERLDGIFHFGGIAGETLVEAFDKKLFKAALDWAMGPVEVVEE